LGSQKAFQHLAEYAAVRTVSAVACVLPQRAATELGAFLGTAAYSLVGIRRSVALDNLRRALGNATTEEELQRIARETYRNLGRGLLEYARFPALGHDDILRLVTLEGRENLDRALEKGKGAIAVSGHFGNWELLGAAVAALGYPVSFLVGAQKNQYVDRLMNRYREAMGIGIIHMGGALKGVVKALRANQVVAILSDQDAGSKGFFVDFFGRKASTPPGAASFAVRLGSPLLPSFITRLPDGRHRAVIESEISPPAEGDTGHKALALTQAYTSMLEKRIRRDPAQWFWVHRRWKSSPPEKDQALSRGP